jgi:hypothetical protein
LSAGTSIDFSDPVLGLPAIAGVGARVEKIADIGSVGEIFSRALAHVGLSFLVIDRWR